MLNADVRVHELGAAAPTGEVLGPLVRRGVLRAVACGQGDLLRSLRASLHRNLPTLEVRVRLNREYSALTVFVSRKFDPPAELDLTRSLRRLRRARLPGLSAATWRTRAVLCPHHVPDLELHTLAYGEPWEQEQLLRGRNGRPLTSRRAVRRFLHQQGHVVQEDAKQLYDQEASCGHKALEALMPALPRSLAGPLAQLHAHAAEAAVINALLGTSPCPPDLQAHCWARTRSAKRDGLGQPAEHLYDQQRENGFGPMYIRIFSFDSVGVPQMQRALRDFAQLDRIAMRATRLVAELGGR